MSRPRSSVLFAAVMLAGTFLVQFGAQAQQQSPYNRLNMTPARLNAILDAQARGLDYIPGEVVVRFKAGMGPSRQQRALDAMRGRPSVSDIHWSGPNAVIRDETQPNAIYLAQQMAMQPEVEFAEPNYLRRLPASRNPTIADLTLGGGLRPERTPTDPLYGSLQWNFTLIDMPRAWDINAGGKPEVVVAVIDTGITNITQTLNVPLFTGTAIENVAIPIAVNPDLPATRLTNAHDFSFSDSGNVIDMDGHGTHVSSTIAEETNNAVGVAGIAYQVKIMPVKVCLSYWEVMLNRAQQGNTGFTNQLDTFCPQADVAEGIRYAADNGAKVMNISLGGTSSSNAERTAIAYAISKGTFVTMSAGNEFEDGNPTMFPASFASTINGAVSVAAVTKTERKAAYSSTGNWVEIAAPGGDGSEAGLGDQRFVWQATLNSSDQSPLRATPRFDRYAIVGYTGTSMASPHVAGLAALLVSQGVTKPEAIETIIRTTAKDLGAPGKDDQFGYGLIQPRAALRGLGIRK